MKILLSEGCPIFREGMKFVLESNGYEVDAAISRKSFNKLISSDYDIIIFDLDMLGSLAIDLAKQIDVWMTYSLNSPCKLIATYKDAVAYYMGNLFDRGLSKPFTKEKLLEIIDKESEYVKRFYNKTNSRPNEGLYEHRVV